MSQRRLYWIVFMVLIPEIIVLGVGGPLYWLAKRAEPSYSGTIALAGLAHPVEVRFGPHAVPTIAASDLRDLVFAQGYVTASERMWQMDLLRRLGGGRLAELFGPEAVKVDRFFRTVGLPFEAQRALAAMADTDRALLDAYAAGVNAYRDSARGRRPLEYLISGLEPAPWQPEDSLVIGAYMAWTQSFNARGELTFLRLARRIGPERARLLFPTDEGIAPPEVPPNWSTISRRRPRLHRLRDPGFDIAALARSSIIPRDSACRPRQPRAMPGWRRAPAPLPARRCSPMIRIWPSRCRASGTSWN
jgi:penicillin G amidase